jgi:hypothetical protein
MRKQKIKFKDARRWLDGKISCNELFFLNAIHAKGKRYEVNLGGVNHEFENGKHEDKVTKN